MPEDGHKVIMSLQQKDVRTYRRMGRPDNYIIGFELFKVWICIDIDGKWYQFRVFGTRESKESLGIMKIKRTELFQDSKYMLDV